MLAAPAQRSVKSPLEKARQALDSLLATPEETDPGVSAEHGVHGLHGGAHKEQPHTCRPWDSQDLFRRLRTFRSGSWFAKPDAASALACASRGWRNARPETLQCEVCLLMRVVNQRACTTWREVWLQVCDALLMFPPVAAQPSDSPGDTLQQVNRVSQVICSVQPCHSSRASDSCSVPHTPPAGCGRICSPVGRSSRGNLPMAWQQVRQGAGKLPSPASSSHAGNVAVHAERPVTADVPAAACGCRPAGHLVHAQVGCHPVGGQRLAPQVESGCSSQGLYHDLKLQPMDGQPLFWMSAVNTPAHGLLLACWTPAHHLVSMMTFALTCRAQLSSLLSADLQQLTQQATLPTADMSAASVTTLPQLSSRPELVPDDAAVLLQLLSQGLAGDPPTVPSCQHLSDHQGCVARQRMSHVCVS